jgi:hypothetical protein
LTVSPSTRSCALAALSLILATWPGRSVADAQGATAKDKGATAKKRAQQRQALLRSVKRSPRVVLEPGFLRKAGLFGLDLPVTIRLTPAAGQFGSAALTNDQIKLTFTGATTGPVPGVPVPSTTATIKGIIRGSLNFSQDSAGYGGKGIVELGFGTVAMTASPFDLTEASDPGPCAGDPGLLRVHDPGVSGFPVAITDAPGSQGYVDFFQGAFSISLHTAFAFASKKRDVCTDPFTPTSVMPGTGNPPLPLRLDGKFRISPAITADGRLRLAKLTIDGPQHDSFVRVHSCTEPPPPPASGCASGTEVTLDGRLEATAFSAEMLVGNVS